MVINPAGASFLDWAIAVSQQLGLRGTTVTVDPEEEWHEWANRVMQLPQVSGQGSTARPGYFDDWLDWAYAFNQSVEY